ncbi:MAG: hypothetical protein HY721_34630 [Planctomycetes bacterium]|nr:hypothetical protein [Planctomycetota bacterium]
MNFSLFASKLHAAVAAAVCAGALAWLLAEAASPGSREGSDRVIVLTSGWSSFALMVACFLYVPRKYFYKLRARLQSRRAPTVLRAKLTERSLALRDRQAALEEAAEGVQAVRYEVERGLHTSQSAVKDRVRQIVHSHEVGDLVRVVVRKRAGSPPLEVRLDPREPLGRMAKWVHAHLYYGVAFALLVWLHGGGSMASLLGAVLTVSSAVVALTGIVGILLFARGPVWLTPKEPDLGYEQCFALSEHLERKVREVLAEKLRRTGPEVERVLREGNLQSLAAVEGGSGEEKEDSLDLEVLLEQRQRFLTSLRRLRRTKFWMNLWRAVHVPASIVLAGAVVVHVASVWIY